MEEQSLKKLENGHGGKRKDSGRKIKAKILDELTLEGQKRVYRILEADFWVRLANDKALPRLEAILDDPEANSESLRFAIKEVNDRAFGKPKESLDLTSRGKSIAPTPEQRARYAKRHVNDAGEV